MKLAVKITLIIVLAVVAYSLVFRSDYRLYQSIPGTPVTDPFPPIMPGAQAGVETAAVLDRWRRQPLQMNLVRSLPGGEPGLLVNDIAGRILLVDAGHPAGVPVLDLSALLPGRFYHRHWERGLLSFALHPEFARAGSAGEGLLYTVHSERTPQRWDVTVPYFGLGDEKPRHLSVVTEWRLSGDAELLATAPESQRTLLVLEQPFDDHNLYFVDFNPTATPGSEDFGKLYIGVGNGGRESTRGRDPASLYGKILRIDPLVDSGSATYQIPRKNPWQDRSRRPEVWAEGFRNPQQFSWDAATGVMYAIDMGESHIEEVNIVKPGDHYGWSYLEGDFILSPEGRENIKEPSLPLIATPFTAPFVQYDHSEGRAIGSGFVYRGSALPELYGKYVMADVPTGRIFYTADEETRSTRKPLRELMLVDRANSPVSLLGVLGRERADLRLAQDARGEILLLNKHDDTIRRLVAAP